MYVCSSISKVFPEKFHFVLFHSAPVTFSYNAVEKANSGMLRDMASFSTHSPISPPVCH